MHKQINFAQDREFPTDKDFYIWNQEALRDIVNALILSGAGTNSNFILSGVNPDGGNTTNGWMVIAGELLPFVGGATQATVIIVETIDQAPWKETGGSIVDKDTYYSRHVEFGTGAGQINLSSLLRIEFARTRQTLTGGYYYLGSAKITAAADWAFDPSGTKSIIHKDQFNRVHIYGLIQYTGVDCGASGQLIATLASDYKPTIPYGLTEQCKIFIDTTSYPVKTLVVKINKTSGEITAFNGDLVHNVYYLIDIEYISE